jgi:hypothetical protein
MQPERNDYYRQLRVLIDPAGGGRVHVTVTARTSRRGVHTDRRLAHRVFPGDLDVQTVSTLISRAGEFLLQIAEQIGPGRPPGR